MLPLDRTISGKGQHSTDVPTDHIPRYGILHRLADYLLKGGHFHIVVENDVGGENLEGIASEGQCGSGGVEAIIHCHTHSRARDNRNGIAGNIAVLISAIVGSVKVGHLQGIISRVVVVGGHE